MNTHDAKEALRKGHESGRWEVEHLDHPSLDRCYMERIIRQGHEKSLIPTDFQLPPHRNLLRELFNL